MYADISERRRFLAGHPAWNQHGLYEFIPDSLRIHRHLGIVLAE